MRFDPWKCPMCGEQAEGTLETCPGIAELTFDDDGEAEYGGYTKMYWDGQTSILDEEGRHMLACPAGHEWPATVEDYAP